MISSFCNAQLLNVSIVPNYTDTNISIDIKQGDTLKHQVYANASVSHNGSLLVFFPGTNARPSFYSKFGELAADLGYYVINLSYQNFTSVSSLCGTGNTNDSLCSEKARAEIIYGLDLHDSITIDSADGIMNRLHKLLLYLDTTYPGANWDNFYHMQNDRINWKKVVLAGHSQGGGHCAFIAKDTVVKKVIFFNSPSDKNLALNTPLKQPHWFYQTKSTPDSSYYAFYHHQNSGATKLEVYNLFALNSFGSPVNQDTTLIPFQNSHIIYTDSTTFNYPIYTNPYCTSPPGYNPHSDIIVDCEIPYTGAVTNPYEDTWTYLLTATTQMQTTSTEEFYEDKVKVYPNPTNNVINIELENINKIKLFSIDGKLLLEEFNVSQINLDGYNQKVFILSIFSEGNRYIKKIVKK